MKESTEKYIRFWAFIALLYCIYRSLPILFYRPFEALGMFLIPVTFLLIGYKSKIKKIIGVE